MSNIEIFEKKTKPSKIKLIIAIILFASCMINEFAFYSVMQDKKANAIGLTEAKDIGEYACVEVHGMTDYFAEQTFDSSTSEKYYFVGDENYLYIANIDSEKIKDLDKILNGSEEEEASPVRICGSTESIPSELKKLAISSYNELYEQEFLTNDNFYDYLGGYYIDTQKGPEDEFIAQSLVAVVFLVVGVIILLVYYNDVRKTKKTLAKYASEIEAIKMEIAAPDTLYDKKAKVFLTNKRIINVASGMEIYDYKDIIWVYPHELRQNGYTTQKSIYVVTSDKKAHIIANISTSKKNNIKFDEIYESLMIKMPDALHGYTQENRQKVKEMAKKL